MLPIQMWDEARNTLSAMEMMHNGDWFVRHYIGTEDTWETKPVLLLWCEIVCFKLLGIHELSIRLPSALATLGIVVLFYRFFKSEWNDEIGGMFAGLSLVVSPGFIRHHVSRTGDHDALLSFFLVWSLLEFYFFVEHQNKKAAVRLGLATLGAVLTKSIVGFMWLPAYFLYAFFSKNLYSLARNKHTYLSLCILLGGVGGYYGICEWMHPGHFSHVWRMELIPRYTNTSPNNVFTILTDKWFYFKQISFEKHFFPLWALLPVSGWVAFHTPRPEVRRWMGLIGLTVGVFLLIISNGSANDWYDAPIYPLLSLLMGLIASFFKSKRYILLILGIFYAMPYYRIVQEVYWTGEKDAEEKFGLFARQLARQHPDWKTYRFIHTGYEAQVLFYMYLFNQNGYKLERIGIHDVAKAATDLQDLQPEQKIALYQADVQRKVQELYEVEWIYAYDEYKMGRIVRPLKNE